MSHTTPLSCLLIGGSNLLVRCAESLTSRGHRITAVVTDDADIPPGPNVHRRIGDVRLAGGERPDVIFSIVNATILRPEEIGVARLAAINYHDSPLPAYAGVNAPSWAILNGESTHGVTWHLLTETVDAGDILVQRRFPIDPGDTALSLSMKCFEHALAAFPELLDLLERGDVRGRPQDPALRTVFGRGRRLPRQGIIRWTDTAAEICRFVRAGQLGPRANDFGLPKILLPDRSTVAVAEVAVVGDPARDPAGTVVEAGHDWLSVTTGDGAVLQVRGLIRFDGRAFEGLATLPGCVLPTPSPAVEARIESATVRAARAEADMCRALVDLPAPLRPKGLRPCKHQAPGEHVVTRPPAPGRSPGEVFAPILARLTADDGPRAFTVGVVPPAPPPGFAALRPCACRDARPDALAAAIDRAITAPPLPVDLPLRFPELRAAAMCMESIAICLATEENPALANPGLVICSTGHQLIFRFAASQIRADEAEEMAARLCGERSSAVAADGLRGQAVHDRVSRWAVDTPQAIAVEDATGSLSYAALERRAVGIASRLRSIGAAPEAVVAILLPPGRDFVAAMLAVLKSGAAYLPLEAATPLHRLRGIVRDARPLCVITDDARRAIAVQLGPAVVPMGGPEPAPPWRAVTSEPDDLAYVIYTSGSTGEPKGSMIEHGALAHFIAADIDRHGIGPGDRVLQLCSVAFDASVEEMFSALCAGATLVVRPPTMLDSARTFLDVCEQARLTIIGIYAAMLGDVLAEVERRGRFPPTVRLVTTGGEAVHAADAARWRAFRTAGGDPAPVLLNVYGLTETTIANCASDLSSPPDLPGRVPIGRPLAGNRTRLVDERLADVATGAVGELLISGPQLARAYWRRPALDADRFVIDPADGTRWCRTGDLARMSPGGELYFEGRLDRQVKVRGVRIELEDVERAILSHPGVQQAAVILHRPADGAAVLTAFISARRDGVEDELRRHLESRLPAAMVPGRIVQITEFPVNDRGKIDQLALQESARRGTAPGHATTSGPGDAAARLWQETFPWSDGDRPDESFFDLGGDSLTALHLLVRAEQEVGVHIPVSSFFMQPTLAGLRRLLRTGMGDAAFDPLITLQPDGPGTPIYMLHGGSGDVAEYARIVARLGDERPILGVRSRTVLGSPDLPGTFERMANEVVAAIRGHRPDGGWILVGYSMAGMLAYETAVQLHAATGNVATIIMIDSMAPLSEFSTGERLLHFARQLPGWLLRAGWLRRLRAGRKRLQGLPAGRRQADTAAERRTESFFQLARDYRPARNPRLEIDLVRASHHDMSPLFPDVHYGWFDNGWRKATGCRVRVHSIESPERGALLREPRCRAVAEAIRAICLAGEAGAPSAGEQAGERGCRR